MRFISADKISTVVRTAADTGRYSLFFRIFYFGALTVATRFVGLNALNSGRKGGICTMALPKKLGISGAVLFAFGIGFGFIAFPPILKSQVRAASKLKSGSEMRDLWSKLPFPLTFKIYLFNITNPMEITKGEKPIVQEVGPFVYDEWLQKVDLEDREEDDTVEFSKKTTWIFNPAKSNGLTGNEIVTVPHLFMLGAVMATMRDKPNMISIAGKAMDSIFKKPDSVFTQTSAHDLLFGGLPIDCTVKDFAGTAVCSLLKENPDLIHDGENRYKFSVFGAKNGTVSANRIRVKRGLKDIKEVGQVTEFDGKPQHTIWPENSRCNVLNGTDGTIFRPYLFKEDDMASFSSDLCRSISARWDGTFTSVGGIHTNRYTANFGDMSTDPELKCFCATEDTCLKKGLYDLFNCVGIPLVVSLPHLYEVDESYLDQVDGLQPSKEEHQIAIDFEPTTGSPLRARNRIQFNIFVFPVEKVRTLKTFATALMPLFWVEESITLDDEFLDQVRMLFTMLKVVGGLKWTMIVLGMGLGGAGAGLEFKRRQAGTKVNISSVTSQTGSQNNSSTEKNWPLNVKSLQADQVPPRYVDRD